MVGTGGGGDRWWACHSKRRKRTKGSDLFHDPSSFVLEAAGKKETRALSLMK